MAQASIYQFKISVKHISPPVWRVVLVPSNITFTDLHDVIIAAFDWYGHHMFGFYYDLQGTWIGGAGNGDYSDLDDMKDARKVKLSREFKTATNMNYMYDFGDSWECKIELQKVLSRDSNISYPVCIKSKGGSMLEDCGGVHGYKVIANWARNKTQANTDKLLELGGEDILEEYANFNPDEFNIKQINFIKQF